ncbi:amino acid ABC transporter ATP-binding protein [Chthonobacter albigriseus]|uniref:amino acid ABC transporter ATP-binding protein n=1 Tax=Chthonobacter albigriseus TaxID=1683161 RepID=UPI0015EFAED9
MTAPPPISATGIVKRFGAATVLDDVSLTVARGEVVCVIGPSGSGKSTLLRCLSWLAPPDAGRIELAGERLGLVDGGERLRSAAEIRRQRSRIGMVFQGLNLWPHLTAAGNVMEGLVTVRRMPKAKARELALAHLDRVGLLAKADAYPARLSGGQQQRVAIARALAMEPEILFFDEPTSALDPELVGEVLDVMGALARQHTTMVVVTHEMSFAAEAADRILFMDEGRVVEEATPASFFGNPREERSRRFLDRTLSRYRLLVRSP